MDVYLLLDLNHLVFFYCCDDRRRFEDDKLILDVECTPSDCSNITCSPPPGPAGPGCSGENYESCCIEACCNNGTEAQKNSCECEALISHCGR